MHGEMSVGLYPNDKGAAALLVGFHQGIDEFEVKERARAGSAKILD